MNTAPRKRFDVQNLSQNCRDAFFAKLAPKSLVLLAVGSPLAKSIMSRSAIKLTIEQFRGMSRIDVCRPGDEQTQLTPVFRPLPGQARNEMTSSRINGAPRGNGETIASRFFVQDDVTQRVCRHLATEETCDAEKMLLLLKYIVDTFECDVVKVAVDSRHLPKFVKLFYSQDTDLEFDEFELYSETDPMRPRPPVDMDLLETLVNKLVATEFSLLVPLQTPLRFDGLELLGFPKITLNDGSWLTADELTQMSCFQLTLLSSSLVCGDINQLLRSWQSPHGGNRYLSRLSVTGGYLSHRESAELISGLDVWQRAEAPREKRYLLTRHGDVDVQAIVSHTGILEFHAWKWTERLEAAAFELFGSTRPGLNDTCAAGYTAYSTSFLFHPDVKKVLEDEEDS